MEVFERNYKYDEHLPTDKKYYLYHLLTYKIPGQDQSDDCNELYYICYISRDPNPLTIEQYKESASTISASIETIWELSEKLMRINSLFTLESERHKGLAIILMCSTISTSAGIGLNKIQLDDDTGYNNEKNIYRRLGLEYDLVQDGQPVGAEMTGEPDKIIMNCNEILKNYPKSKESKESKESEKTRKKRKKI